MRIPSARPQPQCRSFDRGGFEPSRHNIRCATVRTAVRGHTCLSVKDAARFSSGLPTRTDEKSVTSLFANIADDGSLRCAIATGEDTPWRVRRASAGFEPASDTRSPAGLQGFAGEAFASVRGASIFVKYCNFIATLQGWKRLRTETHQYFKDYYNTLPFRESASA